MANSDTRFKQLFTPEYSRTLIFTEIGGMSLEERLGRLAFFLKDLYSGCLATDSYDDLTLSIHNAVDNLPELAALQINWETEIDDESEALKDPNLGEKEKELLQNKIKRLNFTLSIKQAVTYIELAHKSNRENKTDQAWAYACEAGFYCGKIDANSIIDLDLLTIEKISRTNSDNGKAINLKHALLQTYISSLIREHAPKGGWTSKDDAIKKVTSLKSPPSESNKGKQPPTLVEVYIKDNNIPRITEKSVYDLIRKNWMYKCDAIKAALDETVR